ncbi:MAG: hypothetical protein ACOX6D_02500 [Thermoguttaceae bacterium]|jgi:excisionase family DNA binding protein
MAIRIERRIKKKTEEKRLLSAYAAAEYLGVSYPTFKQMVQKNNIPFISSEKRKFFTLPALDRFLETGGTR